MVGYCNRVGAVAVGEGDHGQVVVRQSQDIASKSGGATRMVLRPVAPHRRHEPAKPVTAERAVGKRLVGPDLGVAARLQDGLGIERSVPFDQIFRRRDQHAGATADGGLQRVAVFQASLGIFVACGATGNDFRRLAAARALHAERPENAFFQQRQVCLSGNLFKDQGQHEIAGVAVLPFRPRLESHRHAGDGRDNLVGLPHVAVRAVSEHFLEVRNSGGVGEQLSNRHCPPCFRQIGQVLAGGIFKSEFAILHQQHYCHGGELLGDRSDLEHGVRSHRHLSFDVGKAIGFHFHARGRRG